MYVKCIFCFCKYFCSHPRHLANATLCRRRNSQQSNAGQNPHLTNYQRAGKQKADKPRLEKRDRKRATSRKLVVELGCWRT